MLREVLETTGQPTLFTTKPHRGRRLTESVIYIDLLWFFEMCVLSPYSFYLINEGTEIQERRNQGHRTGLKQSWDSSSSSAPLWPLCTATFLYVRSWHKWTLGRDSSKDTTAGHVWSLIPVLLLWVGGRPLPLISSSLVAPLLTSKRVLVRMPAMFDYR